VLDSIAGLAQRVEHAGCDALPTVLGLDLDAQDLASRVDNEIPNLIVPLERAAIDDALVAHLSLVELAECLLLASGVELLERADLKLNHAAPHPLVVDQHVQRLSPR
jgi:hypothetical protein